MCIHFLPMRATYPVHHILLYLITLIILWANHFIMLFSATSYHFTPLRNVTSSSNTLQNLSPLTDKIKFTAPSVESSHAKYYGQYTMRSLGILNCTTWTTNVGDMYFLHKSILIKITVNTRQHFQCCTVGKTSLNKRRNKVLPQRRHILTYVMVLRRPCR
jgi:hypothetical protein